MSARTLRHYETIGLIEPPVRNGSGYRQYDSARIWRLTQIKHLKALGLSLADISKLLTDQADISSTQILEQHLASVREQIAFYQRIEATLQPLIDTLSVSSCQGAASDELTGLLDLVQHVLKDKPQTTREEMLALVEDHTRDEVASEWNSIIGEFEDLFAKGAPAESKAAQKTAKRLRNIMNSMLPAEKSVEDHSGADLIEMFCVHGIRRELADYLTESVRSTTNPEGR